MLWFSGRKIYLKLEKDLGVMKLKTSAILQTMLLGNVNVYKSLYDHNFLS